MTVDGGLNGHTARGRAYQAVNAELVSLYWQLGEYISRKIASAEWSDGVVDELAASLARHLPGLRGFARRNLFCMRQFYEAYRGHKRVSPPVTQLPWTHRGPLGRERRSSTVAPSLLQLVVAAELFAEMRVY